MKTGDVYRYRGNEVEIVEKSPGDAYVTVRYADRRNKWTFTVPVLALNPISAIDKLARLVR